MGQAFRKLAAMAAESSEPTAGFQRSAYMKAALVVESQPKPIKAGKDAAHLAGIGKRSVALIDEFLETGTMGETGKEAKKDEKDADKNGGGTEKPKMEKAGQVFLDM
jgi:DNA polymerase/3'-5' exonuclease PolX